MSAGPRSASSQQRGQQRGQERKLELLRERKPLLFAKTPRHEKLCLVAMMRLNTRMMTSRDGSPTDMVRFLSSADPLEGRVSDTYEITVKLTADTLTVPESLLAGTITLTYGGPTTGLHLNYFFSYSAIGAVHAMEWDELQKHGIRPRRFMVPVLRAFVTDHLLAGRMVAAHTPFTLEAWGSRAGRGNDQEKLVEMYRTLGFEIAPGFDQTRVKDLMVPMQTTIGTFLHATREGTQAWACNLSGYQERLLAGETEPAFDRVTRVHASNGETHI